MPEPHRAGFMPVKKIITRAFLPFSPFLTFLLIVMKIIQKPKEILLLFVRYSIIMILSQFWGGFAPWAN
jgi:hypothetical protein